jgi:hypothetical protein
MPLKYLTFCLAHAAECERWAEKAKDLRNRETFLFVASRWRRLAEEEEGRAIVIQPGEGEPIPAER